MTARTLTRLDPTLRRRRALAWTVAGALLAVAAFATLTTGDLAIDLGDAIRALSGEGDPGIVMVVREWRLPRAVLGITVGAMLALSGALFQIVTRNPLGSPDILGMSTGAFTGVLLAMSAGTVSVATLTGSAVLGGLAATVAVFALSSRSGASGFVLVVTGIGVTAILAAVNTVIVLRSDDLVARAAAIWATGSLNGVDGIWVAPSVIAVLIAGAAIRGLAPALAAYEFGDDRAATLGTRPHATRWGAMAIAVALVSIATAIAGPIGFIALAAPQIARRAWRTGTIPLAASAATGSVLLSLSDLAASRLLAPTILPTGLVTVILGGIYLAWLLSARERTTR
ncbi:iron chelate uptake ABC transporter family permease subunit [Homoserinibacter sp. GY 40078]|uniref:FecCD family ABC transporter permease n=1 Tax=Homoserinibacter sp. GY 40078 TaxID=2603275 RepID=UPI0011C96166|nr:iron chelate uptake ABC transporter family permease subunit [Homoserinibacter sp. GY 40078]TXK19901.1 iron chelate uptake ABC transporter family permease subunit [Homoserinibacter sp. GY 40078]